jgi:flagellar basal body P-ring formation protein FlgA
MLRLLLALLLLAAPASALDLASRRTVELPVLVRYVPPGQTIAPEDVGTIGVPAERLVQAVVSDAAELIGKTPRRAVRPGHPVRIADIQAPLLVRKGELVTIVLESGAMRLTAQGRASEDGGLGKPVRVANTRSGKMVDALVTASGTVKIESAP